MENTQRFMNEAFDMSTGTNRGDLGLFTKFSLNLVNVALPTLIAPDLVLTHPMSSMSGYVNYIKYTAGSTKGNVHRGDTFNDPFRLGDVDVNYTSSKVSIDMDLTEDTTDFVTKWKPVIKGTIALTVDDTKYVDLGNGTLVEVPEGGSVQRKTTHVQAVEDSEDLRLEGTKPTVAVVVYDANGEEVTTSSGTIDYDEGTITLSTAVTGTVNLTYCYDNVVIPQNDIPLLSAKMEAIPLLAKARRIAIYYSQMSAFQAKTDYGMDLGQQLADKAVGQLAYEIDTEVTDLLISNAVEDEDLVWSKTLPIGVSKAQHYKQFVA